MCWCSCLRVETQPRLCQCHFCMSFPQASDAFRERRPLTFILALIIRVDFHTPLPAHNNRYTQFGYTSVHAPHVSV